MVVENSSAGLVMLNAEVAVTVTGEERHQNVLSRYPVAVGAVRHVAVELVWCRIRSGKYRGQRAIEVRLDGRRVGELTHLMSQRYAEVLGEVAARGGRPGCEAVVQRGARGFQIMLRLPRDTDMAGTPAKRPFASHKPAWIAAAVILVIGIAALANNGNDSTPSTNTGALVETTTPKTTTMTIAPAPAVPVPTTTQPAPPPPPVTTTTTRAPKTTTKQAPPPPPPPPAEPAPSCDPNYTGCVPIASDVDCAGGSGDGPAYVRGPIQVIGRDIYGLDRDHDGVACE